MNRRHFCRSALAAGLAGSLYSRAALAAGVRALAPGATDIRAITLAGGETVLEAAAVRELAESLTGLVITPEDVAYDGARALWNGMHDRRPALVAQCADARDVARAVTFARERSLLLAVKGGGHSFPGKSMCDGGFAIDLSRMKGVAVDAAGRRARVQGGALLYDLDRATLEHGLVTTAGVVSHTGVGGLTLGGGFGRLNRRYGLTIDNLVSAEVVTADGQVRRVSAGSEPDLFWAIRGGGGNFGVVTEFEFRLHQAGPKFLGGVVAWPAAQAREVLDFYADWAPGLSRDLYVGPFMATPPDTQGVVGLEILYAGDPAAGEKELAALGRLPEPMDNGLGMVDYLAMQTQEDGATRPGQRYYVKSGMVDAFTPELAEAMIGVFRPDPTYFIFTHTSGGVVRDVAPTDTAFPHRSAETMIGVFTTWTDPAEDEANIRTAREWWSAIDPHTAGFYANLRPEDDRKNWENFGPNYERLARLKAQYDPANQFRLNSNIPPKA